MAKIVLGFSGGVDSSVCAALLRGEGWEVCGLYMDVAGAEARREAERGARSLDISLRVVNVTDRLERYVCAPFIADYLRGRTPNPCVLCNPAVKFRCLLDYADELGAEFVATGHYARAENGALLRGQPSNDQSYMLSRLTREQLRRVVLPLGGYEKREVRAIAERLGLTSAQKPDSMEICFIPDHDYIRWIAERAAVPPAGDMIFNGKPIGRHEGIHRWTVGQRVPGLYDGRKLYVGRIVPETNEVVLCLWEDLFTNSVTAERVNWLIDKPAEPLRGSVRVRHTKWECPDCTVTPLPNGGISIVTDQPLRAPAPGQSAVVYDGDRVVASGFIVQSGV
ncbi:MAG: tRNA 2-thiouridine(34) synthase MnmA [Oscillospiraceae bacterium]|nr:tRNA 2-thiouridine(34) synthase MnmA [Oscillospiraceae bacterium]